MGLDTHIHFLRPNEVISHLPLFVFSGLPRHTVLCVSVTAIMLSLCLFLCLSFFLFLIYVLLLELVLIGPEMAFS